METLVLTTDFSENSKQAARFGYELARHLNAKVLLLNALTIPIILPQLGLEIWPEEDLISLTNECETRLKRLKSDLENGAYEHTYKPKVQCICKVGLFTDVVSSLKKEHKVDLLVLGAHDGGVLSRLLIGDHTRELINRTEKPALIVPKGSVLKKIEKIAFAAEMKHLDKDFDTVCQLINLARPLHAAVLIAHILKDGEDVTHHEKALKEFISNLSNKANYPLIYYRIIRSTTVEEGLNWLCINGQVDMLAMVHGKYRFFETLYRKSHTVRMANRIEIPLLVFPD